MELTPTFRRSPLYVFVAIVIALWGLRTASDFLIPVFLAALLAFLMAPVMRVLSRWKLPDWACVTVAAVLIVLPLAGFIYLSVNEIQELVQNWPKLSSSMLNALSDFRQSQLASRLKLTQILNPAALQSKAQTYIGSELKLAMTSLQKILSAGSLLVLTVFFAVAMLASKRHLKRSFDHLLFSYSSIESNETVNSMAKMMESFLVARTMIATALGAASFLILLGFGIPYSFLLGVFMGLMTWVPIVGFVLGIAPVIAVGFGSGKGFGAMLGVFLAIGAVWMIQDHIITPKWVGHKLKLNFLVTYLAFFAGGLLWGAWGMILSIPLLGVIRIACSASPKLRPWAFVLGEDEDQEMQPNQQTRTSERPPRAA
jgi:predicted PurR-regulated permease PerM